MSVQARKSSAEYKRARVRTAALAVSLALSAGLVAHSAATGGHHWLALIGLLPLFLAIRRETPLRALLAGALWGSCLLVFTIAGVGPTIEAGFGAASLFIGVPAVYACLGALLTRWIGFSPFVLGVGWVGVELAFSTVGLGMGLLGATQSGGVLMQYVGRVLGYALVAFVVAYTAFERARDTTEPLGRGTEGELFRCIRGQVYALP